MTAPRSEVRELAAAIRDALDLPPSDTTTDRTRREALLRDRLTDTLSVLDYLADHGYSDPAAAVEMLEAIPARYPVTYAVDPKAVVPS